MTAKPAASVPVKEPSYEPQPQKEPVDYAALGHAAIKRFPKVMAKLAE